MAKGARYSRRVTIHYNRFPELQAKAPQVAKQAVQLTLLELVSAADPLTPVDTGNLKNAKEMGEDFVTWLAPYAAYVNYGTRNMAARPFVDQAVAQVQPMFVKAIEQALQGML